MGERKIKKEKENQTRKNKNKLYEKQKQRHIPPPTIFPGALGHQVSGELKFISKKISSNNSKHGCTVVPIIVE